MLDELGFEESCGTFKVAEASCTCGELAEPTAGSVAGAIDGTLAGASVEVTGSTTGSDAGVCGELVCGEFVESVESILFQL